MIYKYFNEDLLTGLNDGSSAENAWQTFDTMHLALINTTFTDNMTLYATSSGVVSDSRLFNDTIITGVYYLFVESTQGSKWLCNEDYYATFTLQTLNIVLQNFVTIGAYKGHGIAVTVDSNAVLVNCTSSGYTTIVTNAIEVESTASVFCYNCIAAQATTAFENAGTGDLTLINCYGNGVTCFTNIGTGTLTLTTCASSDLTGSTGLQSIAYDVTTFTDVTLGAEDFTLVENSPLIGVGTTTSYTTDIDGTSWDTPYDIGVRVYDSIASTFTVTYDGNGNDSGTVLTDSSSPYADGATATVLGESDLGLTGYTFGGWNTVSDGSGISYVETDTFTISANTTLYAQWDLVVVSHTITYDGNSSDGGTVPVDGSSPYDSGSLVTVLGNTGSLTLTGYIFVAWNTLSDGSGSNLESGDTFTIVSDTILYALWKTEAELIEAYLTPTVVGGYLLEAEYYGG